jgi:hypothetical protein
MVILSWGTKKNNMKFINYLEKISGISIYGMSSLLLFGGFFLVMIIWSIKADKKMIEEIRNIPLD